MTNKYIKSPSC